LQREKGDIISKRELRHYSLQTAVLFFFYVNMASVCNCNSLTTIENARSKII